MRMRLPCQSTWLKKKRERRSECLASMPQTSSLQSVLPIPRSFQKPTFHSDLRKAVASWNSILNQNKVADGVGLFMSPGLSLEWLPHLLQSMRKTQKFASSVGRMRLGFKRQLGWAVRPVWHVCGKRWETYKALGMGKQNSAGRDWAVWIRFTNKHEC